MRFCIEVRIYLKAPKNMVIVIRLFCSVSPKLSYILHVSWCCVKGDVRMSDILTSGVLSVEGYIEVIVSFVSPEVGLYHCQQLLIPLFVLIRARPALASPINISIFSHISLSLSLTALSLSLFLHPPEILWNPV